MDIIIVSDTHGFLDPRIAELAAGRDLAVHAGGQRHIDSHRFVLAAGPRHAARVR